MNIMHPFKTNLNIPLKGCTKLVGFLNIEMVGLHFLVCNCTERLKALLLSLENCCHLIEMLSLLLFKSRCTYPVLLCSSFIVYINLC